MNIGDIPTCENCGVKHYWLKRVNNQVQVVTFCCNECGCRQTVSMDTDDGDDEAG